MRSLIEPTPRQPAPSASPASSGTTDQASVGAASEGEPAGAPLRVALVTARYLPRAGGVEVHVAEVARRIAARGFRPEVLTVRSDPVSPAVEVRDGVVVRRFGQVTLGRDLYVSPGLVRQLREGEYDVVHLQGIHTLVAPEVLAHAVRAGAGAGVVVTFHTGGHSRFFRQHLRGLQWRALAPLLRRASCLVAVSRYEKELFAGVLGDEARIELVPNGADPLPVGELDDAIPQGAPLVTSVGRLEWYKGHQRAISALGNLVTAYPAARLVVAGSGPAEARLRSHAAQLGLSEKVRFVSYDPTERGRLGALVARSDVVVLLSTYESHPLAALEAAALGRPLVVTDHAGLHELVAGGLATGVAPKATGQDIAAAVAAAWRSAASCGQASARDVSGGGALALPTWDECAGRLATIYRRVGSPR